MNAQPLDLVGGQVMVHLSFENKPLGKMQFLTDFCT